MLSTLSQYVIPRKVASRPADNLPQDLFRFLPVETSSEEFRDIFGPVITSRLTTVGSHKVTINIEECQRIENPKLETKFDKFRESLARSGAPSDISYGFTIICDNTREVDIIAKDGLWSGNVAIGDLGMPRKGIYLSESPDLTTPAPFIDESTTLRICAFKILKGRARSVSLGSYEMEPTEGCNSHIPVSASEPSLLSRHELYRYNQVYLFEKLESGRWSTRPSNVLPYAIYTIEFISPAKNIVKKVSKIVWKGNLVVKDEVYNGLQLISPVGIPIKPFQIGSRMNVDQVIGWRECIKSPLMVELLAAPLVGDLAAKKELILRRHQRFVSYFTLESVDANAMFDDFFELMRVHSLAGVVDLEGSSALMLIPNGFLSTLLALPFKHGAVFHCLYISPLSLLHGQFIPLSSIESSKFDVDPLLGEKVDGIDVSMHRIARKCFPSEWLKKGLPVEYDDSPPPVENCRKNRSDTTPERRSPVEVDVDKNTRIQAVLSSRPGTGTLPDVEAVTKTIRECSQRIKSQKATDPRGKRSKPSGRDLLLPKLNVDPIGEPANLGSIQMQKDEICTGKPFERTSKDVPRKQEEHVDPNVHCNLLNSSPQRDSSRFAADSTSISVIEDDEEVSIDKAAIEPISDEYIESPASPPPEDNIYIASASRIIPVSDEPNSFNPSLGNSSKIYRAPEVALFPDSVTNMPDAYEEKSYEDDLLRASSKDVDLRFMPLSSVAGPSAFPHLLQLPSKAASENRRKRTAGFFTPRGKDKDDRVLLLTSQSIGIDKEIFKQNLRAPLVPSAHFYAPPPVARQMSKLTSTNNWPSHIPSLMNIRTSGASSNNGLSVSASNQAFGCFNSAIPRPGGGPPMPSANAPEPDKMILQQLPFVSISSLRSRFPSSFERPTLVPPLAQNVSRPSLEPRLPTAKRRVVLPDDHFFFKGSLSAKLLNAILDRFEALQRDGNETWRLKIHAHVDNAFSRDVAFGKIAPSVVECRPIWNRYKDRGRIKVMEPHDCDLMEYRAAPDYYECLMRTLHERPDTAVTFLSNVIGTSELAKRLEQNGIEVWDMGKLLERLEIAEGV